MKWCRFSVGGETSYGLIEDEVRTVDGIPWERHITPQSHARAGVKLELPVIPPPSSASA